MEKAAKTIGDRIRDIRERSGLSQPALGTRLGVKGGAVGKYERGAASPSPEQLAILAELGSVSIDWIITGNEPEKLDSYEAPEAKTPVQQMVSDHLEKFGEKGEDITEGERRVILMLRRLDPQTRQFLLNAVTNAYFEKMEKEEFSEK